MPQAQPRYSGAKALVVGASGQVGTQLVRLLGPRALAAGRTSLPPTHLAPSDWLQVDLLRLAQDSAGISRVLEHHNLSAILCVAGATDVERCQTDPVWAFAVNAHGPAALAAATPPNIPFVYFSTEYVFDGGASGTQTTGPYTEESPTHPISIYGQSKLEGEQRVLAARPDALILRTTVVYGPDPAEKNFLYFLHRQISAGKPVRVVHDQISTPTANDDLASATLQLLERRQTGIVHVCGPDLLSRYNFAVRAARTLGLDDHLIEPVSTASLSQRAPRPRNAGLLTDKLRSILGPSLMKNTEAGVRSWQAGLSQLSSS